MKPLQDTPKIARTAISVFAVLSCATVLLAAETASPNDRALVAKVSQGGLYEVEAGKVAAARGTSPVIRNLGILETHDHEGVGNELKRIATATGVAIPPGLNPEFSLRLAKLKSIPQDQFDAFYVADMKQIHNTDEGLFAREAQDGSPAFKPFAHNTAVLVNAHLGWLNTL